MNERKKVILLALTAAGFRVLHYFLFPNEVVAGSDLMRMVKLGRKFASGDFYGVLDTYWTPLYPFLIGIVTIFINSPVIPALIISIIAGSLAVPATYYLVKQSYGEREAAIAAVIAVFFPHLINSVFDLGTESVYLLWIAGMLIVGWNGLKNNSAVRCFSVGILLGLAYLTRPEAIGYLIFFILLFSGRNLWQRKLISRHWAVQTAALLLGFALLAAPYIFYLRSATGTWTISGKTEINTVIGEFQEPDETTISSQQFKDRAKLFLRGFADNLILFNKSFPFLIPSFLLIFVGIGLFGEQWDKKRLRRETYLILFCLLTVIGYCASVFQVRYLYVLLPIFFGWIARGIVQSERWLNNSLQKWLPDKPSYLVNSKSFAALLLILIYLYVLPINFFAVSGDKAWQTNAYEERDAGLWLKKNSKPSPTVFSASERPAFYAEGVHIPPTTTNVQEILTQIKEKRIDYVVTSERSLKRNPYLKDFDAILLKDSDFELIYEKNKPSDYKISIFRLK